jgi:hypothetical protein
MREMKRDRRSMVQHARQGRSSVGDASWGEKEFLLAAPPKTCGNWSSSSPFRRRSSPHEAERPHSAALTVVATPIPRRSRGFFNESCRLQSLEGLA